MRSQLQQLYTEAVRAHSALYASLSVVRDESRVSLDMLELVDTAFALRECHKFFDDLRKEAKRTQEMAEKLVCLLWIKGGGEEERLRTPYCTASPVIKTAVSIPSARRQPEQYEALMKDLGVPEALWRSDVIRPHWPGFTEYASSLASNGRPLPGGVDPNKTYPIYALRMLRRRDPAEPTDLPSVDSPLETTSFLAGGFLPPLDKESIDEQEEY